MPRRKYGRLQKAIPPPPPPKKCRLCKMGKPCPVHGEPEDREEGKENPRSD